MEELIENFSIEGLSKSPAIFDIVKLTWMNGEYIKKMDFDEFYELAEPELKAAIKTEGIDLKKVAGYIQTRIGTNVILIKVCLLVWVFASPLF